MLFMMREFVKSPLFSDDSSDRLWLTTAFIKSMESCVIGYNAQDRKNTEKEKWWNN